MNIEPIRNLSKWEITVFISGFLATLAPGFLILYLYKPDLLERFDNFKITIFSLALTLPLVVVDALIMVVIGAYFGLWKKLSDKQAVFWVAVWVFLSLYASILAAYFFSLSYMAFLFTLIVVDVAFGYGVIRIVRFLDNPET